MKHVSSLVDPTPRAAQCSLYASLPYSSSMAAKKSTNCDTRHQRQEKRKRDTPHEPTGVVFRPSAFREQSSSAPGCEVACRGSAVSRNLADLRRHRVRATR
jgi:hypothetical protein